MKKYLYYSYPEARAKYLLKDPTEDLLVRKEKIPFFKNKHSIIWHIFAWIGGKNRGYQYAEYQLIKYGKVVSWAEVATWLPAFPFMSWKGVYIGTCRTLAEERGRGYYPYLLSKIQDDMSQKDFCMFIDEGNEASIRGVEKAGFRPFATLKKTKLGFYLIEERLVDGNFANNSKEL